MQEFHVETPDQLDALCRTVEGSPWLALDTEFLREKTYFPQLCLLQLCNGQIAASIDPLRLPSLDPLMHLIYNPTITKVFHAARQDLEIFHHLQHQLPSPLFDTQLAASILGLGEQIGYGNLVLKLLKHELVKGHTRTDWSSRPLDQSQLRYALDDVIYLGEIYLVLKQQLAELGREEWLREDFELLASTSTYEVDPECAWQRIKGRQRLKGSQLAVLRALASWRENHALESDRPRRWILKDEVLLELARRRPTELRQLERIRGLEAGTVQRKGKTLLKLIAEAASLPPGDWPMESAPPVRLDPNQEALTDLLMSGLRLIAEQCSITPATLASRRDLERLVAGERELNLLHGWRNALAGRSLLQILDGKLAPRLSQGHLVLEPLASDEVPK